VAGTPVGDATVGACVGGVVGASVGAVVADGRKVAVWVGRIAVAVGDGAGDVGDKGMGGAGVMVAGAVVGGTKVGNGVFVGRDGVETAVSAVAVTAGGGGVSAHALTATTSKK
jgi:hypothetical protein